MSGMLESLRKNIQSVQDGISAGFHRLSSGGVTQQSPVSDNGASDAGGSDLLTMYQSQWATIRHMGIQNANLAECAADSIRLLTEECENQHSQLMELRSLLAHLPNIMAQLHSSLSTIGSVRIVLEEVEAGLESLEDTVLETQVHEQVLDMRLQVTLRREQRQHRLNMLHNDLSCRHQEIMAATEAERESSRREREDTFTDQFQQDLQDYRAKGHVDKLVPIGSTASNLRLEDVALDSDSGDLEEFLEGGT